MSEESDQPSQVADRQPEPDEEFLAHCELPSHPGARETAFVVRRTIAVYADLKVEMIHALDRIPEDLGDIFIRESLIVVEFVMNLEENLGVSIPHYEPVSDLLSRETLTVKEIIETVTALVVKQLK